MLLTLFYMISTWVQAWRLSSLKARLTGALNLGLDTAKPSIMFYIKQDTVKDDANKASCINGNDQDLLTSHLCCNKNIAKLCDLLWCQGDKRLCTIYPLQKIDVNDWLLYPLGHTSFPLYMNNNGQSEISEESKMHVLIEAEINHFNPTAFTKIAKLEDYGLIVAWTVDKSFALIIETNLDYLTKLSIALMQSQCFMNNGFPLTRIETVEVAGKPCSYNLGNTVLQDKRLVGKAQWEAHIQRLKYFSSTARHVHQQGKPFEVDNLPGVIIAPGNRELKIQIPTILNIDPDQNDEANERITPCTPPPTPASAGALDRTRNMLDEASADFNNRVSMSLGIHNNPPDDAPVNSSEAANVCAAANTSATSIECKPITHSNGTNDEPKYTRVKGSSDVRDTFDVIVKPPNVLIYADSEIARDNMKALLKSTLNEDKYTVYNLTAEEAKTDIWVEQANLVVICGNVDSEISAQLVEYIAKGGKILALCSDALHFLLPSFKTAEVREHELVRFSYGRWRNVRMMHHIFCYQASPIKSKFSQDHEDAKMPALKPPVSANIRDKLGKTHTLQVQVLGTEETWQTPSIILADLPSTKGRAVFSQIHLEADPSQYEGEEAKFEALKQSNPARLEIISDLLASHLSMDVNTKSNVETIFTAGFFLGRHELKLEMLDSLKDKIMENDTMATSKIKLQFCSANTKITAASSSILPIMLHQCPDNFSTIDYFENLSTKELGRLVIYADVMTSSMDVVADCTLHHGLVVIPRQQTQGQGRNKNMWLSPKGCAMFTLQLHIPLNSQIGQHLPLLQHLVPTALITAIKSIPGYENIDLRLKWPNDIYAGSHTKIGGIIVTTLVESSVAICNAGLGINLSNSSPTCCINDVINKYNEKHKQNLSPLTYERFLALVFSEIEILYNIVQSGDMKYFYNHYYDYWLHSNAEVTVVSPGGSKQEVKIIGLDDYGFLKVQDKKGKTFTVHPDGNSFDMLKGLIIPSPSR